jgi:hypothetical protein
MKFVAPKKSGHVSVPWAVGSAFGSMTGRPSAPIDLAHV